MLDATQHMFHATQLHVLVLFVYCTDGVGVVACVVHGTHVECHPTAHTCIMLRNCMCSYCSFTARMGWGWGGERGCVRCFGTHVGCYATAHTCFTKRRSKTRLTGAQGQTNCKEVCQKACEVEASLIDASILGWNGTCTATCGVSTTETGGSSSESCASNNEKKQAKTAKEVFFWWVVVPNVLEGLLRISKHWESKKSLGITNDFDMAHVARHANYMGSLTTPEPCFLLVGHKLVWARKG